MFKSHLVSHWTKSLPPLSLSGLSIMDHNPPSSSQKLHKSLLTTKPPWQPPSSGAAEFKSPSQSLQRKHAQTVRGRSFTWSLTSVSNVSNFHLESLQLVPRCPALTGSTALSHNTLVTMPDVPRHPRVSGYWVSDVSPGPASCLCLPALTARAGRAARRTRTARRRDYWPLLHKVS